MFHLYKLQVQNLQVASLNLTLSKKIKHSISSQKTGPQPFFQFLSSQFLSPVQQMGMKYFLPAQSNKPLRGRTFCSLQIIYDLDHLGVGAPQQNLQAVCSRRSCLHESSHREHLPTGHCSCQQLMGFQEVGGGRGCGTSEDLNYKETASG